MRNEKSFLVECQIRVFFMIVSTANEVFGEGFKNQYETEI